MSTRPAWSSLERFLGYIRRRGRGQVSGRVEGHTDRLENGETRKGCVLLNLILAESTRVTEFVNWGADLGSPPTIPHTYTQGTTSLMTLGSLLIWLKALLTNISFAVFTKTISGRN